MSLPRDHFKNNTFFNNEGYGVQMPNVPVTKIENCEVYPGLIISQKPAEKKLYDCKPIALTGDFELIKGKLRLTNALNGGYTHIRAIIYKHGIGTIHEILLGQIKQ